MNEPLCALRYDRLGYVALNVSNLEKSAAFYKDIVGLERTKDGPGGEALFRCSSAHHDVMLCQSDRPGLKRVNWLLESDEAFSFALEHLNHLDLKPLHIDPMEASALGLKRAVRFCEPTTGTTFEFALEQRIARTPYTPTHTKIARLGHIVLSSSDRTATEKFLTENLNFRVSDRISDTVTFMRCFPNRLHHSFGVGQGKSASLNHVNFMVTEIDDIGRAIHRMKKNEVKVVFGPGRHPPSESVFFYFLDPDGLTLEYSFGMEEFDEVLAREPRELPRSIESIDYWGGAPEPEFGATGVIETL